MDEAVHMIQPTPAIFGVVMCLLDHYDVHMFVLGRQIPCKNVPGGEGACSLTRWIT